MIKTSKIKRQYYLFKYKQLANQKVKEFENALKHNDSKKAYQIFSLGIFSPKLIKSFNNITKDYADYLTGNTINEKKLYSYYVDKFLKLAQQYEKPNLFNTILISTLNIYTKTEPYQNPPNHAEFIHAQNTAIQIIQETLLEKEFLFISQTSLFDIKSYHNAFALKSIYKGVNHIFFNYFSQENNPDTNIIDFFLEQYPEQIYYAAQELILKEKPKTQQYFKNNNITNESQEQILLIQKLYDKKILNQANYTEFLLNILADEDGSVIDITSNNNPINHWKILQLFFNDKAYDIRKYIKNNIIHNKNIILKLNTHDGQNKQDYIILKKELKMAVLTINNKNQKQYTSRLL